MLRPLTVLLRSNMPAIRERYSKLSCCASSENLCTRKLAFTRRNAPLSTLYYYSVVRSNGRSERRRRRLPIPSLSGIREQYARDEDNDGASNRPSRVMHSPFPPKVPDVWVMCSGCWRNWTRQGN